MNICVIPARGGSKRIKKKNLKKFSGKPIILWSIELAIAAKCFDKIIVSTDDYEIMNLVKNYGLEVPFNRPKKLSDDYVGILPVVYHAIKWEMKQNEKTLLCLLYFGYGTFYKIKRT